MKRTLFVIAMLLSSVMMAGSFVKLDYSGRTELERLFADPNLTVHFYNDSEVFATAERFVPETMTLIDETAFPDNGCYTLVYCPKEKQNDYLLDKQANILYSAENYVIVGGAAAPYKNDGAVAILNKKAALPRMTRDFPIVTWENPTIREMLNQVNMDSIEAIVQHLQDYNSRIWNSENAYTASDWIAGRMQALGLEVEQQQFYAETWLGDDNAAPNVIGIQRGTLYPDTYVVCGSHFDSFSWESYYSGGLAPGADDNATGVASVLESARILTQYEFEYSIVYCAFGCEEMGLYGSAAYASRCRQQGMDIIGYFNNDMNGYLNPGDEIHIDCIYPDAVEAIGTYYMDVASVYYPELPTRHVFIDYGDSDHTSFNNNGYMGIYPFEDNQNCSPYIHTPDDVIGLSVNSFEMSRQYCQMNIACLAEIANPVGASCNPVTGFFIEYPDWKEMSWFYLVWQSPEDVSLDDLNHFDVYRDNELLATVDKESYYNEYEGVYYYKYEENTLAVGDQAEYYIVAVYSDGCEAASQTEIGYGIDIQALEEVESHIMIYPNPSSGTFNLELGDIQYVVEVYEITGRKIYENSMSCKSVLDLGECRKGLYFLKITGESGGVIEKIVIQ